MTTSFGYKKCDLYKSVYKLQNWQHESISSGFESHDLQVYCWNKGSSGKQMPEGGIWSMQTAGKAGRVLSWKPGESAQKNVTKETFLVSMRHEVLNESFSMVQVFLLSENGVGQQVSSYCNFLLLSREDYKVNSLLLAPEHYPRSVCGTSQKSGGSTHLWTYYPFHHAGESWVWKLLRGCRQICLYAWQHFFVSFGQ